MTGGGEEFYCADTCAAGVCGAEETCYLNEADCTEGPCPPVAECGTPPASPVDKCGGSCLDSEVNTKEDKKRIVFLVNL